MLKEIGEILLYLSGFILALYPLVISIVVDCLLLAAIIKGGSKSDHPFLTGMLFGFIFSNRGSRHYDPLASYIGLVILAPLNGALAVLLSLYLGMPLLAWTLGLIPAGALVLLGVGALFKYFGPEIAAGAQQIINAPSALYKYLKEQKPGLGIAIILLVSLAVGTSLLFYFGLPLYAYATGFATTGTLTLLALGYLIHYIHKKFDEDPNAAEHAALPVMGDGAAASTHSKTLQAAPILTRQYRTLGASAPDAAWSSSATSLSASDST